MNPTGVVLLADAAVLIASLAVLIVAVWMDTKCCERSLDYRCLWCRLLDGLRKRR